MFAYCRNNPAHTSDPTGRVEEAWKWWLDGAGGYAGGSIGGGIAGCDPVPTGASSVGGALGLSGGADGQTVLKTSIAAAALIAHLLRKGDGNIYTVYYLTEPQYKTDEDAPIFYVGRVKTINKEKRMNYHKNTRGLVEAYSISGLTYEEARGIEEISMVLLGSLRYQYPYNVIHGVSRSNPKMGLYFYDGLNYLEQHLEQDFLDLYESYIG